MKSGINGGTGMTTNNKDLQSTLDLLTHKVHRLHRVYWQCWLLVVVSLVFIGVSLYFSTVKSSEVRALSVELTQQQESIAAQAILSLVDKKLALLKQELMYRNNLFAIFGGMLLGLGLFGIISHRSRLNEVQLLHDTLRHIQPRA